QGAAEQLQDVLNINQRVDHPVSAGSRQSGRYFRYRNEVAGLRESPFILASQIGQRDIQVQHGHVWRCVAEEFHDSGKIDTRTKHLGGVRVSELVRNDLGRESGSKGHLMQVISESAYEGVFAEGAGEQSAVWGKRIERAEEAEPLHER